jgi:hypothetical protein
VDSNSVDIDDLSRRLAVARERLERASRRIVPRAARQVWEEYEAAAAEALQLERLIAAAKGEEYAESLDFPVRWSAGAPLPHLFVNDNRALLAFLLAEHDPDWDGTWPVGKSLASAEAEPLAVVEFEYCQAAKLGAPNDEVFSGHPLNGRGREPYAAQRVVNSRWLKEIEAINSVHPLYQPEMWRDLRHFIFWFHDSVFECVAESFKVEICRIPMRDLLHQMVERLVL